MIKEFIRNQSAKARLRRCFKSAGLIDKHKSGDKEVIVYPRIHDVKFDIEEKSIKYVFTIVNGTDPKEVIKKQYVFNQYFGKNIELEGDYKKFELTVYQNGLEKRLLYCYDDIETAVKELKVPIVCGKDRNGKWVVYDAVIEPNALISGEPGSGKSTQLRSILTTLIKYKSPDELHLYLGDLKMSEFHLFKGVQHVKSVCVLPEELERMLKDVHKQLQIRGRLLDKYGVMHIDDLPPEKKVPYIILAIDEIVMVMDNREIKKMFVQIASLGRALGIYIILSLQRPSHDILDAKVRSLVTVRMGFRAVDLANAKLIGTPGCEKITKETPGRMVLKRDKLLEIQAPYLTDIEAKKELECYKSTDWKNLYMNDLGTAERVNGEKELTEEELFNGVLKNVNQT